MVRSAEPDQTPFEEGESRNLSARVRILGPVQLTVGTHDVPLGRGLRKLLVARLALGAPDVVPFETLLDEVWPARADLNDPGRSLHTTVWRLRQSLDQAVAGAGALVEHVGRGYRFSGDCDVDVAEFRRLLRPSQGVGQDLEPDRLEVALALWAGPCLSGLGDAAFVTPAIAELEELRWSAVERRARLLVEHGRSGDAVIELRVATGQNPLRESLWAALIEALHRDGRTVEALRAVSEIRQRLAADVGLDLSSQLAELEGQILRGELPNVARTHPVERGSTAPTPTSTLVGRIDDLQSIQTLLANHRSVTIAGPPGCGKTRLAVELAHRSAGPVWWVDLAAIDARPGDGDDDTPADLAATVAAAVGIATATDPLAAIVARLALRPGLIVLDNAEHVALGVVTVCSELLAATPHVSFLVTSRAMLDVPGAATWPLDPLDAPDDDADYERTRAADAVELFLQRAWSASPRWRPLEHEVLTVGAITRAVDGLPLALEIAAARVRSMSVDQIAEHLPALTSTSRGSNNRGPLRPALEWSWGLLDPSTSELLERLSVFAGPFSLDDAVVLGAADPGATAARIDELVRNSLVAHGGSGCTPSRPYRLLATVRALGEERLADRGAWADAARAHFALVAGFVQGPDSSRAVDARLEFLAALGRSSQLGLASEALGVAAVAVMNGVWANHSLLPHSIATFDLLLDRHPEPTPIRALGQMGYLLMLGAVEDWPALVEAAHSTIELGDHFGELRIRTGARCMLALGLWGIGRYDEASHALDSADALGELLPLLAVFAPMVRARIAFDTGDPVAASAYLAHAAGLANPAGKANDDYAQACALVALEQAWQAIRTADPAAPALVDAASQACARSGWHNSNLDEALLRSHLQVSQGDAASAQAELSRVLDAAAELGDVRKQTRALDLLAVIARNQDDLGTARALLSRGDDLRRAHRILVRPADAAVLDDLRSALHQATS